MAPSDRSVYDKTFKILICGSKGSGKDCLCKSFSTDGDDQGIWTDVVVEGERLLVEAETSRTFKPEFVDKYDAVAVVFSTTERLSYEHALEILNELRISRPIVSVVIENKIDNVEASELDKDTVEREMKSRHKRMYRVSATQELNVMHPFAYILERLTRYRHDENANRKSSTATDSM